MKQCCFLFFISMLIAGCNAPGRAPDSKLYPLVEKMRSFVFVNTDSVQAYRNRLQSEANHDKTIDAAFLKYADALYHVTAGVHNKALTDFDDAITLFEKAKADSFVAFCRLGKGNCYKLTGNSDSAVLYYLKSLSDFESLKKSSFVTATLANLAETYEEKEDLPNTKKYIDLAKANESFGSKTYISVLHLQANYYGMSDKKDSALETDKTGIALATQFGYPDILSQFYDNMAQCYLEEKKYDSARTYYFKCISLDSTSGRLQLVADTYKQLVQVFADKNEEAGMKSAAARALELCDSTDYLRGKYDLYQTLDQYFFSKNDLRASSAYKDSALNIYKKLINQETEARTTQYNIEFETAHKEKLISEQEGDLRKIKYTTALLSILAALLIISIVALYRNYKKGREIAVSKAIREQKDINTKSVFETEQGERIRIARDLHDSIGQKLSVLKMYISAGNAEQEKTSALLNDTITEVRNVSHNLLPEELNFGLLKALRSDIDKTQRSGVFHVLFKTEETDRFDNIPLPVSLNILMIFRELISNLIRHSKAKNVTATLSSDDTSISLRLSDDGVGITRAQIDSSKGIGWKNIFARIDIVNGKIFIDANQPHGNIVTVNIPVV